jgi:chaperonin GroES
MNPVQQVRPLGNQILLQQLPKEEKTAGGLFYAERYQEEQRLFKVLAVGPGRYNGKGILCPPEVSIGDYVLVDQYTLQGKTQAGDNEWLIDAAHVALVVRPEPDAPEVSSACTCEGAPPTTPVPCGAEQSCTDSPSSTAAAPTVESTPVPV